MTVDRASGLALVVLAALVVEETWRQRLPLGSLQHPGPGYAPVALALALLACGALLAALGGGRPLAAVTWAEWPHAVAILGACAFAALALERLGYRLTVAAALAFLLGAVERKPPLVAAVFAAALAAATYFVFDTVLRVPLPRGPFGL